LAQPVLAPHRGGATTYIDINGIDSQTANPAVFWSHALMKTDHVSDIPGVTDRACIASARSSGSVVGAGAARVLNADFVGNLTHPWVIGLNASASEGVGQGTPGIPDGGSSLAYVDDTQLLVDFALTEALIQAAEPTLSQTVIDQGLADPEVIASAGADLIAFPPQFAPEPGTTVMLLCGVARLVGMGGGGPVPIGAPASLRDARGTSRPPSG